MSTYSLLKTEMNDGVFTVALNRPEVGNAFNDVVIKELTDCFMKVGKNEEVWAIVLTGVGNVFCAGADLNWMQRVAKYTEEENYIDALAMDQMFYTVDTCSKFVLARVSGPAIAGGVGLLAVSDFVLASREAKFGFTEVNLGIIPAVISPYVMRKIGYSHTRALFLTAEIFTAERAKEIGLVHEVVEPESIDIRVEQRLKEIAKGAPIARATCKEWLRRLGGDLGQTREESARLIARLRASSEGQEGIRAFLEKRKPSWMRKGQ